MMKLRLLLPLLAALVFATLRSSAQGAQNPDRLKQVLAEMDTASEHFKAVQADFVSDYYQAVVRETSSESGTTYFEHASNGTQMGAVFLDAHGKKKKVIEYKAGQLRYYDVPNNQVRVLKAGANQSQYESFLTLGFGGSGRDLARAWNITDLGPETLTDNGVPVKTEKLELVSKNPEVVKMFTHVTIWVDPVRGVSLRQVFDTPSHDKRTATYTHIALKNKVDESAFEISKKAIVLK